MLFERLFCDSAVCNPVPMIWRRRVSRSLGDEIADVIASAYLFAVSGAVEANFWKRHRRAADRTLDRAGATRESAVRFQRALPAAYLPV
jgi:hypothetical protein